MNTSGTGSTAAREVFEAALCELWHPLLTSAGFVGDGEYFQRSRGEVIQVIGIQQQARGGSCCVNLAVHPAFLPLTAGGVPAKGAALRAESCEFRWRLAPEGFTDYWWAWEQGAAAHLPLPMLQEANAGPRERAKHLVQTWLARGEPAFDLLSAVEQIAALIGIEDLASEPVSLHYCYAPARAGLTMARIHRHLGNAEAARKFARAGLERVNPARVTPLRSELEAFLQAG